MVLSNSKCIYIRIQSSQASNSVSNDSLNRIEFYGILILQLETDYFSSLFISEMLLEAEAFYSLPRLPENFILLEETYRILPILYSTQKDNSTTRNL